jgi:hypothetical protein
MNGANMLGVHLRKTWLEFGRYFVLQFLLGSPLQREYEKWMGNFCSFSYGHINSRYNTTAWRRLPVIAWPRYRKIACALCKLLKRTTAKTLSEPVYSYCSSIFFPVLTVSLTVLSLTAFLFVVMKNCLSFKRTESCLCCTRNMVIKMFLCRSIVS